MIANTTSQEATDGSFPTNANVAIIVDNGTSDRRLLIKRLVSTMHNAHV